jgi:release factor glutamine methyltransferase
MAAGLRWKGFDVALHADVYRPDEDTFLLADAVVGEILPGDRFLEVGCGAGLVAMAAARAGAIVTATDRNPHAVGLTKANAKANSLRIDAHEGDLLADLAGPFDVVAFNPPYLPTAPDEIVPGPLNLAFDGGLDGNATVLRFARQVVTLAEKPRAVLVVHSSLSDPAPLTDAMALAGYACTVAAQRKLSWERLRVLRIAPEGT